MIDHEKALANAQYIRAKAQDRFSGLVAIGTVDDVARAYIDRMEPVEINAYLKSPHLSFLQGDCLCGASLRPYMKFCPNCGKPIKWKSE